MLEISNQSPSINVDGGGSALPDNISTPAPHEAPVYEQHDLPNETKDSDAIENLHQAEREILKDQDQKEIPETKKSKTSTLASDLSIGASMLGNLIATASTLGGKAINKNIDVLRRATNAIYLGVDGIAKGAENLKAKDFGSALSDFAGILVAPFSSYDSNYINQGWRSGFKSMLGASMSAANKEQINDIGSYAKQVIKGLNSNLQNSFKLITDFKNHGKHLVANGFALPSFITGLLVTIGPVLNMLGMEKMASNFRTMEGLENLVFNLPGVIKEMKKQPDLKPIATMPQNNNMQQTNRPRSNKKPSKKSAYLTAFKPMIAMIPSLLAPITDYLSKGTDNKGKDTLVSLTHVFDGIDRLSNNHPETTAKMLAKLTKL